MSKDLTKEESVFAGAMELHDPTARAAYVRAACGNDISLRQRIEERLRACPPSEPRSSRGNEARTSVPQPSTPSSPPPDQSLLTSAATVQGENPPGTAPIRFTEQVGDKIGHYRLREKIGEGGYGIVYVAEQEEPVRRKVALKVIKLGMDTREVVARFEAERQALALMDHPNIARVFDGGATDAGRPYFVLELVRGTKITDYCDQHNLPTVERLKLFIQVCQAIQHAHQKGIIHRDIKPANILVSLHDDVPVPKVIDFGIAKAIGGRLTDKTVYTAMEQFMGTPAYMSPEQAGRSDLDIDTRSDIYALGVLLYELLAGRPPFDPKQLVESGLDEMIRCIREEEPLRPSTRLSRLEREELTTMAQRRGTEPPKLISLLKGDLDWIVMKCLEKNRARRYEAANALAHDIECHLNQEPVTARPPSTSYRVGKFVRRNKVLVGAGCAVALALVLGITASTWQAVRASRLKSQAEANELKARTEGDKSRQVAQFLQDMLEGVGPSVALGRDTKLLREILDKTAERVGKDLTNQPQVEAELRIIIGCVYEELGEYAKAEEMQRRALALNTAAFGEKHPAVARSLNGFGIALYKQEKLAEAETMYRRALELNQQLLGEANHDTANVLGNLALLLGNQGRLAEAEKLHRQALGIKRKILSESEPDLAISMNNLALVLASEDKLDEAESLHRQALALQRKYLGDTHPDVALSLHNLANLLENPDRLAEAEGLYREALAIRVTLFGEEHPDVASTRHGLAFVRLRQGFPAEAENLSRQALAICRKKLGNAHPNTALTLKCLADTLQAQNKLAEAETAFREALAIRQKLSAQDPSQWEDYLYPLVSMLRKQRQSDAIEQLFSEVLTPAIQAQAQSAGLFQMRADFFARRALWKEAAADLRKAIELNPAEHWRYHCLMPLLAEMDDQAGFRALGQEVLSRFGGTNNPVILERMAKACLLAPGSDTQLSGAGRLAEQAVNSGTNHIARHYFECVQGLAEYRQGHSSNAVAWLNKGIGQPAFVGSTGKDYFRETWANAALAMAAHQLQQTNEARAALAKAAEIAGTRLPKKESVDLGRSWPDWLIAHLLLREAKALIEKPASASDRELRR